jgi:hypothetical protein
MSFNPPNRTSASPEALFQWILNKSLPLLIGRRIYPPKAAKSARQVRINLAQIDLQSVTDLQIAIKSDNSVTKFETPGS